MQTRTPGNTQGIDVSRYQGTIDWAKVKASGMTFVFIKATEGRTYTDPNFQQNVAGALAAGMLVGTYHFFRGTSTEIAKAEAAHYANTLQKVGGAKALQLPPVMDYENNPGNLSRAQMNTVAKAFLTELERLTGIKPIIYTGNSFAGNFDASLGTYDLWIARYSNTRVPDDQPAWKRWTFWQYTDSGKVNGIAGNVDMNEFEGTAAQLRARYAPATTPPNPPKPTEPTNPPNPTEPPKGGEPMTTEEKAAFDALKAQVERLQARQQMEVPIWAKAAVEAALAYDPKNPLFSIDNGASYDFYRFITVMYRRGLFKK
ncbi:glycoside hydrolase family 25 protein [Paenibacillus sp. MER 99-2]|uniref:glycoside hydrolase family 25 protein n=1 Tax=Paenibacillus sp. MER 99-2 TaxID=2939572 RepID=UPI002041E0FA|nr:glycoside hydrolase family 25 protein [Paenibacillus sp. MER 99-2]MCM3174467.1 glycoside hydrolase family 25 protein [Paenibacillus sp. MER 99-2]